VPRYHTGSFMWKLTTPDTPVTDPFTFRLMPGSIKTLGRATRADFVVDAPLVSRFHCRFTAHRDGGLELEDLESTNGTFVNDERITRLTLKPGDRVRAGRVELIVEKAEEPAAAGA
jgi:pSer/pThr/pTyr-binding forkhead associated (FHA) protein